MHAESLTGIPWHFSSSCLGGVYPFSLVPLLLFFHFPQKFPFPTIRANMWLISHRSLHQYIWTLLHSFFYTHSYDWTQDTQVGGSLHWLGVTLVISSTNWTAISQWTQTFCIMKDYWVIKFFLTLKFELLYTTSQELVKIFCGDYIYFGFQNKKNLQVLSELSIHKVSLN